MANDNVPTNESCAATAGADPQTGAQRPIRLGMIGAGIFARDAYAPSLRRLGDRFEVAGVYSRTAASARALVAQLEQMGQAAAGVETFTDLDALLAQPQIEAVCIVLPIANVPDAVARALRAGKHVLSEKPIAPDSATALEMMSIAADRPELVWMVGENWRYEDAFVEAGNLIRSGRIGEPILCEWTVHSPVTESNKYYHTTWRRDGSFPGGFLLDGGVHHTAVLRMVVGEVAEVNAAVTQIRPDLPPADTLTATLRFENGALGSYAATYAAGAPWESWLNVTGSAGSLRVQRSALELTVDGQTERLSFAGFNGVELELAAFAHAIRDGAPHLNTPQAGLADLRVVEAFLQSAQRGQTMRL